MSSGLALIVALAIDDRVPAPATDTAAPLSCPPVPAPPPPQPTDDDDEGAPTSEQAPRESAEPRGISWHAGASAGLLTWSSPRPALELGVFTELSSRDLTRSVRLSVFDARQVDDVGAVRTQYVSDWLRLDAWRLLRRIGFGEKRCLARGERRRRGEQCRCAGSAGTASCGAFCDGDPRSYLAPLKDGGCRKNSLANPWPVIAGCTSGELPNFTLRCPHPFQSNSPNYGPFVACCPPEVPYSCPNGTPNGCFRDAESARAACADSCVECILP